MGGLKIIPGQKWKTRRGYVARIYAVDGVGDHPIHGAIREKGDNGWELMSWTAEGVYREAGQETAFDLLVKELDPHGA